MIRILLADDHDLIRGGLRRFIEQREDWQVCGEARNGREAVELAARLRPHIVILDLTMPELNGLEAARRIKRQLPNGEILVFTMHHTEDMMHDVLAAGALGYLLKSDASAHIEAAVETLAEHRPYFTAQVSEFMLDAYVGGRKDAQQDAGSDGPLTSREREILQLVAEGRGSKAVASILDISVKTVETHRTVIMRKLGTNSTVGLVRYAVRHKLVEA
jgi:DNA-binding NarL/FixJ family response regulator